MPSYPSYEIRGDYYRNPGDCIVCDIVDDPVIDRQDWGG